MSAATDANKEFFETMKNIIRNGGHYELQNNFFVDENGNKGVHVTYGEQSSNCLLCSRYVPAGELYHCGYCDVLSSLMAGSEYVGLRHVIDGDEHPDCGRVVQCDAFDEVKPLNIIRSFDEMVAFIERTRNFFDSIESFEKYFGFELLSNEDTGIILETVSDYADRGGTFRKIPTQFPSVIRFDIDTNDPLEWISISDSEER